MTHLAELPISQLRRIIAIKEKIEILQEQIDSIAGGGGEIRVSLAGPKLRKKRRMSRAARARIAAGQKARWARVKGKAKKASKSAKKKDRRSSPAVRAKLAAAARARWKKARAAGKKTL